MAKRKRKTIREEPQQVDRSVLFKLNEISEKLGVNMDELLERFGGDPNVIIDKWKKGEILLLNE